MTKGVGMVFGGVFALVAFGSAAFSQDVTLNGGQVVDECIGGTGPVMVDYLEATKFTKGYELAVKGSASGRVTYASVEKTVNAALENTKYYLPELEPVTRKVADLMLQDLRILLPYTHGAESCGSLRYDNQDSVDLTCVNSKLQAFTLMLEGSLQREISVQLLATKDVEKYRFRKRQLRRSGCKIKNLAINMFGNFGKAPFLQVSVGLLERMNAEQISWFVVHESFLSALIDATKPKANTLELVSDPARRMCGFAFSKEAVTAHPDRAQEVLWNRHFDR